MVNLITCDSYFELFPTLSDIIKNSAGDIKKNNIIFCEAKVSLMVERYLCSCAGGSFSTAVFSFGKYLLKKRPIDKALTKEGSAMVIKRILGGVSLKCLKSSRASLAPSLYDLIIQLKSAKISPDDLLRGAEQTQKSILQNKLFDIAEVYSEYERFLADNFADDQSSILSYLPEVIENDKDIAGANVYILGYSGFTAQARAGIERLMACAKSFTAILTEGDNAQAFVNETSEYIRMLAKEQNQPILERRIVSSYTKTGKEIINTLFTPVLISERAMADDVYSFTAKTPYMEAERVASIIKSKVLAGECRYKNFTVAIPEDSYYGELLSQAFLSLDIPFFLDEKKNPTTHPLVTLIVSYLEAKRKNLERNALSAFYKNPIFCLDKDFADAFENYTIKYNVNFNGIRTPFTFEESGENFIRFEEFRQKIVRAMDCSNVLTLLSDLSAEQILNSLTESLKQAGEIEESAQNEQIYSAVTGILGEIQTYLGGTDLPPSEYKNVFLSGINALELSIIPQYNDAVFVGGYKETALSKADYLFVVGLTDAVPAIRQDVALLSDGDIELLEEIKVKVEPKIKVVNHRMRECVALALGAFKKALFISYPLSGLDGKEKTKGEVFNTVNKLFACQPFPITENYLTEKQGRKSFARAIGLFADGEKGNIDNATAYYMAVGERGLKRLLDTANKDIKTKLDNRHIEFGETSPTTIEEYFKCPYRTFLSKTLRLEKRKEGALDALSVGVLIHEILKDYALNLDKVTDKASSDELFERIKEIVLKREEFKRYLTDVVEKATAERVFAESKKYCYNTFLSFQKSDFKVAKTEAKFGSSQSAVYPALSFSGGRIKLKGTIDRVDESDKYFRILDYKTGEADSKESSLFYGEKLQLYLYAAAVKAGLRDKMPAGLYYLPVSDKYDDEKSKSVPLAVGKTLDDECAINAQDNQLKLNKKSDFLPIKYSEKQDKFSGAIDQNTMRDFIEYSLMISECAGDRLCDGFIAPSPMENACDYCDFKGMCDRDFAIPRKQLQVDESTITGAVNGGEKDGKAN